VASYADYCDTLISWSKHIEGFQGHASEHTPVAPDVSYGRTHSDCSNFYSKETVSQNLFSGRYTGRFIMYSGITKIYYRKTVGHVIR